MTKFYGFLASTLNKCGENHKTFPLYLCGYYKFLSIKKNFSNYFYYTNQSYLQKEIFFFEYRELPNAHVPPDIWLWTTLKKKELCEYHCPNTASPIRASLFSLGAHPIAVGAQNHHHRIPKSSIS